MGRRPTALVVVAAWLAAAGAAAAAPAPGPPTEERAWTARIVHPVAARRAPRVDARVAMRLTGQTPWTRGAQVLLVLGSRADEQGRRWVRVGLPRRPNGSAGWIPAEAARLSATRIRIRVALRSRTLTVLRSGRPVERFRAAVGKPSTPTATGLFAISDPVPSNGELGPYVLVLTAYSEVLRTFLGGDGVAAIHGWGDPSVLGHAASNGCVRLSRDAVRRVAELARAGTPVEIAD